MVSTASPSKDEEHASPKVVVSGSYKRAVLALARDFAELTGLGCAILSPSTVDFVKTVEGFAYTRDDVGKTPRQIENQHLRAIAHADFIWLHAPEGYVGLSGALEVGFAEACGVPVFSRDVPTDVTIREFVRRVESPLSALRAVMPAAAQRLTPATFAALDHMQSYYNEMALRRGYSRESIRDVVLLMTEEVGELARAVRKAVNLPRHGEPISKSVSDELADVFLYVLHLANVAGINLGDAVHDKEVQNAQRSGT
ncbi:MAG TPA: MazG nucleotide pyrophosphohydrolase domain-containing protein [Terriglobales bacterium]